MLFALDGTPGGIRTPDLLLRRQLLYPTELLARIVSRGSIPFAEALPPVERMMGIEPTYPAWKAGVLPLNYIRTARPQMFSLESIPSTESIVNSFFFAKTHKSSVCSVYSAVKPFASPHRHRSGKTADANALPGM